MTPKHSTPARSASVSPAAKHLSSAGRRARAESHWKLGGRSLAAVFTASLAFTALLVLPGCEGAGVGDPCIPEDEYRSDFGGYSKDEVNVESRSFQCETRVCLVNKFEGRVSCPYGQEAAGGDCKTPDGIGIEVAVPAQLVSRRPSDAVYCSCRCSGPQANAPYCECPDGFSCADLIDDIGLGNKQLAGGYCVKNGSNPKSSKDIDTTRCTGTACGSPDDFY